MLDEIVIIWIVFFTYHNFTDFCLWWINATDFELHYCIFFSCKKKKNYFSGVGTGDFIEHLLVTGVVRESGRTTANEIRFFFSLHFRGGDGVIDFLLMNCVHDWFAVPWAIHINSNLALPIIKRIKLAIDDKYIVPQKV